jgi:tryptophan synthase alpha chain
MSISQAFASSRAAGRLEIMPFVPAGYPSLDATRAILPALADAGAGLIEIGIPFSDPIADGPVIQEAFTSALSQGVNLEKVLESVRAVRPTVSVPLVAMVSFSVAFKRGVKRFSADLKSAGFDGLILPDLPPPEAHRFCDAVRSAGLDTILLCAPTTPRSRRQTIAELSSGFVYYLSVSGITGERATLPDDLVTNLADLRSITDKPLCVGFGLSTRAHVQALQSHADGAIVGSALVRRLGRENPADPQAIARAAAEFCRSLRP